MFGKLMPKEGKYFDHFNHHAALIVQGGQLLTELITALAGAAERCAARPSCRAETAGRVSSCRACPSEDSWGGLCGGWLMLDLLVCSGI